CWDISMKDPSSQAPPDLLSHGTGKAVTIPGEELGPFIILQPCSLCCACLWQEGIALSSHPCPPGLAPPSSEPPMGPQKMGSQSTKMGSQSTKMGSQSTKMGSQSTKMGSQSTKMGSQSPKWDLRAQKWDLRAQKWEHMTNGKVQLWEGSRGRFSFRSIT
uniref:Uncharacterized protein n=1 Tax=Serinus canaria TaxID=9135 RepID=A0A8C9NSQ0_SERCA